MEPSSLKKALTFFAFFGVFFTGFSAVAMHFPHNTLTGIVLGGLLFLQILFVLFAAFLRASLFLAIFPLALTIIAGSVFEIGLAALLTLGIPLTILFLSVREARKNRIHLGILTEVRRPMTHFFLLSGFFACFLFVQSIFQFALPPFIDLVNKGIEPMRLTAENALSEIEQTFANAKEQCQGNAECEAALAKEYENAKASVIEKTDFFAVPSPEEFEQKLRESDIVMRFESSGVSFESILAFVLFLIIAPFAPLISLFASFLVFLFFWIFRLLGVFSVTYRNVPQAHII